MASFTDRIAEFNPYVQQLPVEAMVQVGTHKQALYDQGYQKIQANIDNIAGMDVIRDVDKAYLQSKLGELKGKLKGVAVGDFSNYQIVNNVGGMITQIGKDKYIQNAVGSSAKYRKGMADMETAKKEGKLSAANQYNFEKQASQWLNSQNIEENFNGQYNPHFDVDKYVRETFDSIKPDGFTSEQLYLTDDQGNIVKDKRTGQPILSPVMSKLKQEGKFPKKVQETLDQIFLDSRVQQQLSIDGEYNYRGLDSNYLKQAVSSSKSAQVSAYDDMIRELTLKKTAGGDASGIQAQIDDLNAQKVKISTQFEDIIKAADTNPDYVRGLLYKENVRDNYKSMYTDIKEERTYEENPIWNQNFKMQQEANRMAIHGDDLRYKYTALEQGERQHQDKLRLDINKAVAEGKLLEGPDGAQTFMPTDIDLNTLFDETFNNAAQQYKVSTDDLLFSTVFQNEDEIASMLKADKSLSREQAMDNIIRNTATQNGESPESFRTRWSMKALNQLNKSGVKPVIQNKLDKVLDSQKKFSILSDAKQNVTDVAGNLKPDYIKDLQPITYAGVTMSPQDQYDAALVINAHLFADKGLKNEAKAASKRLNDKGLNDRMIGTLARSYSEVSSKHPFKNLIGKVGQPEFVQSVKDRSQAIQKFYNFNPILSKNLVFGKETEIKERYDQVAGLIGEYQKAGKNLSPGFVDKASQMAAIASDPKKGTIRIESAKDEITGEVVPKFTFYNNDGFVGEMTVTPQQAQMTGFNVASWYSPDEVKVAELKLSMNGTNTTNVGGLQRIDDPYTYRTNDILYSKRDFPNLRSMKGVDVKANIAVDNGQYFSYVYVVDKTTGNEYIKPLSESKPSMDEALQLLGGITPQIVQAIIAEKQNQK